jgi:hypothetical protein
VLSTGLGRESRVRKLASDAKGGLRSENKASDIREFLSWGDLGGLNSEEMKIDLAIAVN